MSSSWLKPILILAAVWAVALGVIFWVRSVKVTPASLAKFMETRQTEGLDAAGRAKLVEQVAGQLNRLGFEERREVRMSRKMDAFFKSLTSDEQMRFLDLTLPTGFKQMMEALNKMDRPQRQRFVTKALADMRKREGEERPPVADEEAIGQKIIEQGFKSFYSEASAETKMDVAPLIEQLQKNLQGVQ